ncbi:MAG TPA: hypothetical protein VG206_18475, partial [Terriglobia bacterium]|nr:hypothetical protein [Terriglobia bacterium]
FLMSYSVFGVSLSAPVAVIMVRGQVRHLPLSPTRQEAAIKIKCIKDAFESELQSKLFLFIFPHHAPYFSDDLETGREVSTLLEALSKFTKASRDAMEAGNCFAFERFTACVHHLSKVVEYGLVSFAAFAGVEGEDRKNWNKALNKAQHNLRERIGNFSGIDDRSEQYYSECLGLLRNFKTAWRNPVSHIPEFFDEPKAKALFTIANSTMTKLSERFGEVGMPEGKDENAN